ncbi:MAG: synthase sector subunit c [Myxococcaceae bacterium]|nr:synthase sector subunit c [Myxococcaceae bacterium]
MKKITALSSALLVTFYTLAAFAQETVAAAPGSNSYDAQMMAALGAGIAIGVGALGGALAQGRVAAAALEGIARNPGADAKIRTPMILGLALIESLVLYALLIAYFLQGKVGGH